MRLFYILFFLLISLNFAGFASQKKEFNAKNNGYKESFISTKAISKLHSNFQQDNESLQRDFISNTTLKISTGSFLILLFLVFLQTFNRNINSKILIKRLKYNYWCLFKMLYPKHFFW
ncbi:hypothetical protein ACFOG5_11370 [Pedobacter fastidiosus]|uniref:Uncharacterized protein n=1 Tax=Pedobacter fastidiosus TaxID=2765361 RepID=A0ABR7KX29_9SPHI|nr:hypothetical protein [Pedobacter fastidiosus]MBC6112668.1 hypothetical protein [Pedobacter fastidiosus]